LTIAPDSVATILAEGVLGLVRIVGSAAAGTLGRGRIRAVQDESFRKSMLSERNLAHVRALNEIARQRGQSLAQMAIAWVLRKPAITSALVGASSWPQIEECLGALRNGSFHQEELEKIDAQARDGELNIWAASSQSG